MKNGPLRTINLQDLEGIKIKTVKSKEGTKVPRKMQPYTFRANGNHAKWTNTTNEMVIRNPRNWVANYGRETICRDNLKTMTDKPYFTDGSTIDGFNSWQSQ